MCYFCCTINNVTKHKYDTCGVSIAECCLIFIRIYLFYVSGMFLYDVYLIRVRGITLFILCLIRFCSVTLGNYNHCYVLEDVQLIYLYIFKKKCNAVTENYYIRPCYKL